MQNFIDLHITDFRLNKKQFNRFLSIGLIFSIFGYFYIIAPYFEYKTEKIIIDAEHAISTANIEKHTQEVQKYNQLNKELNSELRKIRNEVQGFPDKLARSLALINDGGNNTMDFQQQMQNTSSNNNLGIPDNIQGYNSRVKWYINNWFKEIIDDIHEKIILPVTESKLNLESKSENNITALATTAIQKIDNHIQGIDPNFWHSYHGGKVPVSHGLEDVVETSLAPVFSEIDTIVNISNQMQEALQKKIQDDSDRIIQIKENIQILEQRINSVESPIGKIPLKLVDFVQLFPLLIIVLIVMLTNYCLNCIKSAGSVQDELKKSTNEASNISLYKLTDCWFLPPFRSVYHLLMLIVSIIIIAGIYVLSVLNVLNDSEIFISFTGTEESTRKIFFYGAYGLGLLIFAGCIGYIQKRLRSSVVRNDM